MRAASRVRYALKSGAIGRRSGFASARHISSFRGVLPGDFLVERRSMVSWTDVRWDGELKGSDKVEKAVSKEVRSSEELFAADPVSQMTLADVLSMSSVEEGRTRPRSVPSGTLVTEAVRRMKSENVSGVLVASGENGELSGVFEDKDYVQKIEHGSFPPEDVVVDQLVRQDLVFVQPRTSVLDALRWMLAVGYRHVPILSGEVMDRATTEESAAKPKISDVEAVVSIRDLVTLILEVQRDHRRQLRRALRRDFLPKRLLQLDQNPEFDVASSTESSDSDDSSVSSRDMGRLDETARRALELATEDADEAMENWYAKKSEEVYGQRVRTAEDLVALQLAEGRDALLNCLCGDAVSAASAANEMADRSASCVAVVHPDGSLEGIFTVRDFLFNVITPDDDAGNPAPPLDATTALVEDHMTSQVRTAKASWTIERCARLMIRRHIRHLPVVQPKTRRVIGVLSLGDVARALIRFPAKLGAGTSAASEKTPSGVVYQMRKYMNFLSTRSN